MCVKLRAYFISSKGNSCKVTNGTSTFYIRIAGKKNFAIETREIEKTVKVIIFFIHLDISIRCRDIRIQSFSNFNRKQEDEF